MRALLPLLAALTLGGCMGAPGEPLQGSDRAPPAPAAQDRDEPSAEEQFRRDMIAEIALSMGEAADISVLAADAGLTRNMMAAELAAAQALQVAEQVEQRALEVVDALADSDAPCGEDGAAASDEGVSDQEIQDAVATALCAAAAAQAVSAALVPAAATTECVCGVCEEIPGGIDEAALAQAIDDVTAAAEACGDSEDVLTDGNNTSI